METHLNPRCKTLLVSALLGPALVAHAAVFTNDTLISSTDTNFEGQEIVVTNCTLTVDGPHTFADLQILNGGVLTHPFPTNSSSLLSAGVYLTVSNNVLVAVGGAIDVTGRGFGPGSGTGAGTTRTTNWPAPFAAGSGGSHGGLGGPSSTFAPSGHAYDSASSPRNPGSGGGAGSGPGGSGGGIIWLTVGATLQIDGRLLASGSDAVAPHSGGGSGGAIMLSASTVSGAGSISANGGAGEPFDGGGGGGGRIAIYWGGPVMGGNSFSGAVSAYGGSGATSGGAGTVHTKGNNDAVARLRIDNGGLFGAETPLPSGEQLDLNIVGSSRVDLQACKLEYSIVSPK